MSDMTTSRIGITTDDGVMPGHLWLPASGTGPGVLLLQEIFGVSAYIRRRAVDLAAAGYVVVAPELYWRLEDATLDESSPDVLEEAITLAQRLDWATTVQDAVAALEQLRARDEVVGDVGVLGFCFGGGLAFNVAAVAGPDVLVSYYGSAIPALLELAPQVSAPSLHHFGLSDDYIDAATVERIQQALSGESVRFETYPGANHAFDNPDFPMHHPEASALAWSRTLDFLGEHLRPEK